MPPYKCTESVLGVDNTLHVHLYARPIGEKVI